MFLLAGFSSTAAAQSDAVPGVVAAQLDRLRLDWPEVPQAEMRPGRRFEYSGDAIGIGATTLAELETAPDNESGVVLAFLLGHEGWHAVQGARHTPAALEKMRRNRMRECEADFMGGAAAYRFLASQGLDELALERAHHGLTAYVGTKAALAGKAETYPDPEARVDAVAIGWGQAKSPALIRYEGRDSLPASEAERATNICRKIAAVSDSSISLLDVNWVFDNNYIPGPVETHRVALKNRSSSRAIVANLLVPAWLRYYPRPPLGAPDPPIGQPVAFDVVDSTITLAPNEQRDFAVELRRYVAPDIYRAEGYHYSAARTFNPAVSSYAVPLGSNTYCLGRISIAPGIADRIMLAKFGTIATAAKEDFRPIAGELMADARDGQTIPLMPGLRIGGNDRIRINSSGNNVDAELLRSAVAAGAIAEYARMKTLLETVCGSSNIVEESKPPDWEPDERILLIRRFAAKAAVRIYLRLDRRVRAPSDNVPNGGDVTVTVARDPSQ